MSEEEKRKLITESIEQVGTILALIFKACELEDGIYGTIQTNLGTFELKFKRIKLPEKISNISGSVHVDQKGEGSQTGE